MAKAVKRTVVSAVKRTVMSPDYMVKAWATRSGNESEDDDSALFGEGLCCRCLEIVPPNRKLVAASAQRLAPGAHTRTDALNGCLPVRTHAFPPTDRNSYLSLIPKMHVPADALNGCRIASHGRFGAHVLPLYPETTAGAHPVCTDVPKLMAAREEGRRAVQMGVAAPLGLPLMGGALVSEEEAETAGDVAPGLGRGGAIGEVSAAAEAVRASVHL